MSSTERACLPGTPQIRPQTGRAGGRVIRSAAALARAGLIAPADGPAIDAVTERYALAITPTVRALIEHADDPIGRQFVPDPAELHGAPHELPDPIGDAAHSPLKGVVHRYTDRALLKPLLACPV
jgi:lysine 2,3-aminomutase